MSQIEQTTNILQSWRILKLLYSIQNNAEMLNCKKKLFLLKPESKRQDPYLHDKIFVLYFDIINLSNTLKTFPQNLDLIYLWNYNSYGHSVYLI